MSQHDWTGPPARSIRYGLADRRADRRNGRRDGRRDGRSRIPEVPDPDLAVLGTWALLYFVLATVLLRRRLNRPD